MKLLTLKNLKPRGKTVFVRVDFNVVDDGKIIDKFRIESAVPTLRYLLDHGSALVLASHNGRPEGKVDAKLSLEPVAKALANMLDRPVHFVHDCVGEDVVHAARSLQLGDILLLENLRFHKEEEANDKAFAKKLASLAEAYVDDAFANAHRAHASMDVITQFLPHAAGLLMQKEYDTLHSLLEKPDKPFTAIVGGAKISDKLGFLNNLIEKVDNLVISGAIANTFLYALGHNMGKSLIEKGLKKDAVEILAKAKKHHVNIFLPTDLVTAKSATQQARAHVVSIEDCESDQLALDIGPASAAEIVDVIHESKTVFWNGTLGYAEVDQFAHASYKVAHALATSRAKSIIGGGDTAGFIDAHGMHNEFDFVSTGGGASLELLAGNELPAIQVLMH